MKRTVAERNSARCKSTALPPAVRATAQHATCASISAGDLHSRRSSRRSDSAMRGNAGKARSSSVMHCGKVWEGGSASTSPRQPIPSLTAAAALPHHSRFSRCRSSRCHPPPTGSMWVACRRTRMFTRVRTRRPPSSTAPTARPFDRPRIRTSLEMPRTVGTRRVTALSRRASQFEKMGAPPLTAEACVLCA